MAEEKTVTQLRISESLYEKVKAIADKELRSVNNQIEYFLMQAVLQYESENRGKILP